MCRLPVGCTPVKIIYFEVEKGRNRNLRVGCLNSILSKFTPKLKAKIVVFVGNSTTLDYSAG